MEESIVIYTWGKSAAEAHHNAGVMETIADMAIRTGMGNQLRCNDTAICFGQALSEEAWERSFLRTEKCGLIRLH